MAAGDFDLQWAADTDLTITLASLASDTNLLAGRESTAVVSSSQTFVEDYLLSGQITTGTTPTDNRVIEVWAYAQINDTPTYPDVLDGTDSNETITSDDIKAAILRQVVIIGTDNTSDQAYPFAPVSVVGLFGALPQRWGTFVVHNTGVNLNSTGGNHFISAAPQYGNVASS